MAPPKIQIENKASNVVTEVIKVLDNVWLVERFKLVADKDMKKMSNIVENLIRRYVESRV